MYIKTFEDVRKYILNSYHVNILVELGLGGVFPNAQVDAVMYVLEYKLLKADGIYINLTKYKNHSNKPQIFLSSFFNVINNCADKHVYKLTQSKLKEIDSYPFIYWITDDFREKFTKTKLGNYTSILEGVKTGNNSAALRFHWEISPSFENNDYWCLYTKGGPYNKWYGNVWTCVNRRDDFKLIKSQSTYNIPAIKYKIGITYSKVSSKGTDFRILESDTLYDSGACSIFSDKKNIWVILSVTNSILIRYACECLNPTVNTVIQDIRRLPYIDSFPQSVEKQLEFYGKQCVDIKKEICSYSLIEPSFKGSPININKDVISSIFQYYNYENALLTQILLNESIINNIVFSSYELTDNDRQMVLDKEGVPVGDLPVSHKAKEAYYEWLMNESGFKPSNVVLEHLEALDEREDLLHIDNFEILYQGKLQWEEFCIKNSLNPVEVWWQFKKARVLPKQRTQIIAFELITDVIRSLLAKDNDGVIPLVGNAGEVQLVPRIEAEMVERGYNAAQIAQVFTLVGNGDLKKYLQDKFLLQLCDELDLFKQMPATPFIWHLTSGPHHALELFVSIYKWNRDTLLRIKSVYAANREAALNDRLQVLMQGDATQKAEAAEVRTQLKELATFCEKIDQLLASGYNPKLDDGVGKNIAPLQKAGLISYEVLKSTQLKKYLEADW